MLDYDLPTSLSFIRSLQEINTAERHVCLTRDVHTNLSLSMETTVSKVTIKSYFLLYKSRDLVYSEDAPPNIMSLLLADVIFLISGKNSGHQCQEQSAGPRTPWSPSPGKGKLTGVREEEKRHRHQRGGFRTALMKCECNDSIEDISSEGLKRN